MRIHYYKFPENTNENILLSEGCGVVLKNGNIIYPEKIPEDKRDSVKYIDNTISGNLRYIKGLLKKYGGCAWTEHCERDGALFEVTEIKLSQNNSRFKYNRHL